MTSSLKVWRSLFTGKHTQERLTSAVKHTSAVRCLVSHILLMHFVTVCYWAAVIVSWVVRESCWALQFSSNLCAAVSFKEGCQACAMCFPERSSQCWHFHHLCPCQHLWKTIKTTWQAAGFPSHPQLCLKPRLDVLQWNWLMSRWILSDRRYIYGLTKPSCTSQLGLRRCIDLLLGAASKISKTK